MTYCVSSGSLNSTQKNASDIVFMPSLCHTYRGCGCLSNVQCGNDRKCRNIIIGLDTRVVTRSSFGWHTLLLIHCVLCICPGQVLRYWPGMVVVKHSKHRRRIKSVPKQTPRVDIHHVPATLSAPSYSKPRNGPHVVRNG